MKAVYRFLQLFAGILLNEVVQSLHHEWITDELDSSYFVMSTWVSGSFLDLTDSNLETGVKIIDSTDGLPYLKVKYTKGHASPAKSVFVYTDASMTAGDLNIYIHKDETLDVV